MNVHPSRPAFRAEDVLSEQDATDVFTDLGLTWYLVVCVHGVHIVIYMGQLVYITLYPQLAYFLQVWLNVGRINRVFGLYFRKLKGVDMFTSRGIVPYQFSAKTIADVKLTLELPAGSRFIECVVGEDTCESVELTDPASIDRESVCRGLIARGDLPIDELVRIYHEAPEGGAVREEIALRILAGQEYKTFGPGVLV